MEKALQAGAGGYGWSGHAGDWIHAPKWDLTILIGSAAVVPLVLFVVWAGVPNLALNITVTALIGGPHVFSTYLATYADPAFRRTHKGLLLAAAILIPAVVIYATIHHFQILLSFFIFAASIHVLQQNAYLTDIYRARNGQKEVPFARLIDYGLLSICIYPIAAYKLVHSDFKLGDTQILIPDVFMTPATYYVVWGIFGVFLMAWLAKTAYEWSTGRLNVPKTILIAATTVIAFFIPAAASGERLELAFQAVNTWHSLQYLGIIWYVQKVRKEMGLIESPTIRKISGSGKATWYFYGTCFAITAVLFGLLLGLYAVDPLNMPFMRYFYMGLLSVLLIHYFLDGWFFAVSNRKGVKIADVPFAAPAAYRPTGREAPVAAAA